eukprot:3521706-Rhodomonas_salina.1
MSTLYGGSNQMRRRVAGRLYGGRNQMRRTIAGSLIAAWSLCVSDPNLRAHTPLGVTFAAINGTLAAKNSTLAAENGTLAAVKGTLAAENGSFAAVNGAATGSNRHRVAREHCERECRKPQCWYTVC